MPMYRNIRTEAPEYEPLPFYTSEVEEEMDLATWLREASTSRQAESEIESVAGASSDPGGFGALVDGSADTADAQSVIDLGGDDQGDVAAGD